MQRICVFAGSNEGTRHEYMLAAREMGKELVKRGLGLVYGGASIGLMGAVADSVLAAGGEVIGVMPRALINKEIEHRRLTTFHEVGSMHDRKALMADLADGFIALPGGLGTFDELFEILTWAHLGLHQKPVGVLNVSGYYDPLFSFIGHALSEGFIRGHHLKLPIQAIEPGLLLEQLAGAATSAVSNLMDVTRR